MQTREDPLAYADRWSKAMTVDPPLKSEVPQARKALWYHASLLYSNPLADHLKKRDRYRQIREQLQRYADLIDVYGFIQTTVKLSDMFHSFLRGFLVVDGHLTYEMSEDLLYCPLYRAVRSLTGRTITESDLELVRFIGTWLSYLSKLPLSRPDLESSAKIAWAYRQVFPTSIQATSYDIEAVRKIVSWLLELNPQFIGNHGPGSTSTGAKTVSEKNAAYRPTLQTQLLTRFDVDSAFHWRYKPRNTKWLAVFKDAKSLRPITAEPPEMQFAQQGLKHDIYRVTDVVRELPISRFVQYSDQTHSQRCALRGSRITRDRCKPSTIDLKAASDNLSVDLVVQLFSGDLLHYLMLGRTWKCDVGDVDFTLAMYGGMGSALTFPVQTTIFTAITIWACILEDSCRETFLYEGLEELLSTYLTQDGFRSRFRQIERSVRVYGDDICVPDFAAERLIKLLGAFGLIVNTTKSFIGDSPVRESCGIYALAGWDITPKRFRIPVQSRRLMDTSVFEASRQHANAAFLSGYKVLYRAVIHTVTHAKLLIGGKELKRKRSQGSRFGYKSQQLGPPSLLFEEDRGPDDYIGFISRYDSAPTHLIEPHELIGALTTYAVKADMDRHDQDDFYYLTVNYRQMGEDAPSFKAHGSVVRGVRFVLRNAIRRHSLSSSTKSSWGWAPR